MDIRGESLRGLFANWRMMMDGHMVSYYTAMLFGEELWSFGGDFPWIVSGGPGWDVQLSSAICLSGYLEVV